MAHEHVMRIPFHKGPHVTDVKGLNHLKHLCSLLGSQKFDPNSRKICTYIRRQKILKLMKLRNSFNEWHRLSFSLTYIDDEICEVRALVSVPPTPLSHGMWLLEWNKREGGEDVDFCFKLNIKGCNFHSKAEGRQKEWPFRLITPWISAILMAWQGWGILLVFPLRTIGPNKVSGSFSFHF